MNSEDPERYLQELESWGKRGKWGVCVGGVARVAAGCWMIRERVGWTRRRVSVVVDGGGRGGRVSSSGGVI
jgi:hypothetical protein